TEPLRDKLVITDDGSGIPGFADWAEQLIAESTGKEGTGLLPVIASAESAALLESAADVTRVSLVADPADEVEEEQAGPGQAGTGQAASLVTVGGTLGAQLLLWEVATAVAGRLLGINPFDQPDVESAKNAARELMEDPSDSSEPPLGTEGAIEIRTAGTALDLGDATGSVTDAVDALLAEVDPDRGYLAVMVYLDRLAHADLAEVRGALEARIGRPVTFGWGPRFLHSTGQFHKGGPDVGVYLQVTGAPAEDLPVPGKEFTLGTFIAAQAAGDAKVLGDAGRPVLRLHLTDQEAGLAQLADVLDRP